MVDHPPIVADSGLVHVVLQGTICRLLVAVQPGSIDPQRGGYGNIAGIGRFFVPGGGDLSNLSVVVLVDEKNKPVKG